MSGLHKRNNKSSQGFIEHTSSPMMTIQHSVDKALNGFYDFFESKPFGSQKKHGARSTRLK
jgi:hypothetical protein